MILVFFCVENLQSFHYQTPLEQLISNPKGDSKRNTKENQNHPGPQKRRMI